MHIKSLDVQNFKTLKKFSIEFTKGFNLIIGENNTGKSNVLGFLNRVYTEGCTFEVNDISTINNTERLQPDFELETSIHKIKKYKNKYYVGKNNVQKNLKDFKNDDLNKIKLIYIDIQKEYSNLIQSVIKDYNALSDIYKQTYDSQINIDFSEVMGNGNSIFLKDDSIYVIDEYADTSEIENKSSGVQRIALIICILNLFKVEKKLSEYVLLIDEPEGNLHVKAQKKMFEMLKNAGDNHQVIISSHSTIFMQNLDFAAVNYIERSKNEGSYIDNVNLGVNNFKKIRDSLGLEISDTLFLNNEIVAVEGYSDVRLHTYIYERLYPSNYKHSFFTIEGANNALQNIITLKQILNKEITIILDNDPKGNDIQNEIRGNDFVKHSRILFQPSNYEGEIEDMFPNEFLKETINNFIDKQGKAIKRTLGQTYDTEIEKHKTLIDDFKRFSEIDMIGEKDNNFSLKGQPFVSYIIRILGRQSDVEFHETVKLFKSLYNKL